MILGPLSPGSHDVIMRIDVTPAIRTSQGVHPDPFEESAKIRPGLPRRRRPAASSQRWVKVKPTLCQCRASVPKASPVLAQRWADVACYIQPRRCLKLGQICQRMLSCKVKRQYLLALQVCRYSLFALQRSMAMTADMGRLPNVVSMLDRRRRRGPALKHHWVDVPFFLRGLCVLIDQFAYWAGYVGPIRLQRWPGFCPMGLIYWASGVNIRQSYCERAARQKPSANSYTRSGSGQKVYIYKLYIVPGMFPTLSYLHILYYIVICGVS